MGVSTRSIAINRHHGVSADITQSNIVTQRIAGTIPADQQRRNIDMISLGDREIAPDIATVASGVVIRQQVVNQRIGSHTHAEGVIVSGTMNAIVIDAAGDLRVQIDRQIRRRTAAITTDKGISKCLLRRYCIGIHTPVQLIGVTTLPINGQHPVFTIQHRISIRCAGSRIVSYCAIRMEGPVGRDTQIVFATYRKAAMQRTKRVWCSIRIGTVENIPCHRLPDRQMRIGKDLCSCYAR
ncbi:TPA: hypothetical protein ACXF9L_002343 [Klebsiella pneumoniae]